MPSSMARVAVGERRKLSWRSPIMTAIGAISSIESVSSNGAPGSRCWKRRSHRTSGHKDRTWRITKKMPIARTPRMTLLRIGVFRNTRSRS